MDVTIQGISKQWGTTPVLQTIDLHLASGEFVALLGPSGCGKSTLLRILAGLESADRGRIFFDSQEVSQLAPAERNLAMVFQSYALFPHLTVQENILFGLKARRVAISERQRRLQQACELLGLQTLLARKPGQLSGGQRQRVALARAIVSHHPLCLMDEPLCNLDAQLRADMRSELRALQRQLGLTVLYVTHDQVEAMSMADRIVLMDQGRIEQTGTPLDLYQQPASRFCASFIGQPPMNLFHLPGMATQLGVRPEHLRLSGFQGAEPLGKGMNHCYPAMVLRHEFQGADTLLQVELEQQRLWIRLAGHVPLAAGSGVNLGWLKEHEHHFCLHSGQRLSNPSFTPIHPNKELHHAFAV